MQKLQLYISNTRIDLFKDESVSITQTIKNVKDISKLFTEFTQSFTIPASKTNNKIFKHYYNYDITLGSFDARFKVSAKLELNSIPFKKGFIRLEGVELKKNKPYAYKITFFGETVNLKDIVAEDDLSDIFDGITTYDLDYDFSTVRGKLIGSPGAVVCPLITHTRQLYYQTTGNVGEGNLYYAGSTSANGVYWSDLKYAMRLYEIIQQIQNKYTTANGYPSNLVFSTDFFSTSNADFYNLYMWLSRKSGTVEPAEQVSIQYRTIGTWNAGGSNSGPITSSGTGIIVPGNAVTYPAYISEFTCTITPSVNNVDYNYRIKRNGFIVQQADDVQGQVVLDESNFTLNAGTYTIEVGSLGTISWNAGQTTWSITGQDDPEAIGTYTDTFSSVNTISQSTTFEFKINEQIPKIKVIDFLTGLFKMFNLVAYVNDAGTIVVQKLSDYYAASTTVWDINDYIDVKKSKVDVALPYKEIDLEFKGLKTFLAQQYTQLYNKGWGSEEYVGDRFDGPSPIYKVQVPFEHLQYQRLKNLTTGNNTTIQWGWFVNENKNNIKGSPLIFYNIYQSSSTTAISLKNTASSNSTESSYNIPSNSRALSAGTSTSNINFYNETNEYTNTSSFTGTLFKNYYEDYITEIFSVKRRLTKITAFLPMKMIYNMKLNDKISLDNRTYKINSVKTNLTTGKSDFELLNVVV